MQFVHFIMYSYHIQYASIFSTVLSSPLVDLAILLVHDNGSWKHRTQYMYLIECKLFDYTEQNGGGLLFKYKASVYSLNRIFLAGFLHMHDSPQLVAFLVVVFIFSTGVIQALF